MTGVVAEVGRVSDLRQVVALAARAPSVLNTQPWHWRLVGDSMLELYADPDRRLRVIDPRGRLMTVSLGAALHHAEVAIRSLGRSVRVERWPHDGSPDLVARLHVGSTRRTDPADRVLSQALLDRRTDRRPFGTWDLPASRVDRLRDVARERGVTAVALGERQRAEVIRLVAAAASDEQTWPAVGDELHRWTDTPRGDAVLSDEGSAVLVLCTRGDERSDWLLAGEALSEVWLTAVADGLGLVPVTLPLEVPETRDALRAEVLGLLAHPQMMVTVGWPHPGADPLPPSPRRHLDDVVIP